MDEQEELSLELEELQPVPMKLAEQFRNVLEECYEEAEHILETGDRSRLSEVLGDTLEDITTLASFRHAARGVVLTLATYKVVQPSQDIRRYKAEFENGFSARSIDTKETVPFLDKNSLPFNVSTHWLSQTFSFADPYEEHVVLKTTPKKAGPLTITVINAIEKVGDPKFARAVVTLILLTLIEIRNMGKVALTKPKNLSIDRVMNLLERHMSKKYKTNAPRLPQIAVYTLYECLMGTVERYASYNLRPLERMKAANRKSGSVGDIDVELNKQPIEAVEIKYQIPVNKTHLAEAIQ